MPQDPTLPTEAAAPSPPGSAARTAPARGPAARFWPLVFVVLWSTGFIGTRYGLPYAPPLSFLALRFAIVLVVMGIAALLWRAAPPRSAREAGHIAVTGLLVHGVYLAGVFIAIDHGLPAGITALVVGMQPLITAMLAGRLFSERVSRLQWLGLALGFGGVALVVGSKMAYLPAGAASWMILPAVAALIGITSGTLYQKRFCPRFDLLTGSLLQYAPCLIVISALALAFETKEIIWSADFFLALGWLTIVLSIGAVSLLNLLIREGGAVNVASLFYLTPVVTALMAFAMFDETLSLPAVAGMVVAVTGVWLARR